jgi:hypothetical protein
MASTLPINIPIPAESSIVSYDWTDLAEGTGMVTLQAFGAMVDGGTTSSKLDKNVFDTGTGAQATSALPVTYTLGAFNFPRTLQGTCFVSATFSMDVQGAGSSKLTFSLLKNSTSLASATTGAYNSDGVVTFCIALTIPLTSFAIGDVLGLKVERADVSGTIVIYAHNDPLNRDNASRVPAVTAATNHTNLEVVVPFKVDL